MTEENDDRFGFEPGDTVLIRVREHGDSGPIVSKIEAECDKIANGTGPGSPRAYFELDWGLHNRINVRQYEAEFEVIDE